jgi:hypothetical protein
MKMIADKINGFAEKDVSKAGSSSRYVAICEILIVCYRLLKTGFSEADIRKHIIKKYIKNTIHPKYKGLCLFEIFAKILFPNLRGDCLHKKAVELCLEFEKEKYNEFSKNYKLKKYERIIDAFLEQYEGIEIVTNINKIIEFIKMKSQNKFTSIQFFVENDSKSKNQPDYKYDEFYGDDDLDGKHTINILLIYSNGKSHALLVMNPDKMTGYKSCPKCHQFEFKISDKHHGNRYGEHVKNVKAEIQQEKFH